MTGQKPGSVFHLGFRTKLIANARARQYFAQACGVARFAYNWALERWNSQYKAHRENPDKVPAPDEAALRRQLNAVKAEEYPWMLLVTKCAPQNAIRDLGRAFRNFFRNPEHFKHPKFKKKYVNDSFTLSNDQFRIEGSCIRIPLLGWVRMHEPLRFRNARLLSATVSRRADGWYVSFACETSDLSHLVPAKNQGRIGVDLGITAMATLSDGRVFEAPKPLRKMLGRLEKMQQAFSRTKKGSQNRRRLAVRIARLHKHIADVRADALHKLTTMLSSNYSTVVIEDLNVRGMMANHRLALSIGDIGFYEFRRQLEYKMALRGGRLVVADRFFPSSRLCRFCGGRNGELKLSDRSWKCPACERRIADRDLNAALNLYHYEETKWGVPAASGRRTSSASTADKAPPAVADHDGEPDDRSRRRSAARRMSCNASASHEVQLARSRMGKKNPSMLRYSDIFRQI